MKARDLGPEHVGQTILTGKGGGRRRAIITAVGQLSTYTAVRVDYPNRGSDVLALTFDTDIDIEI
ncbi:hypothetical protein [Nocardia sp. NPDC050435]|uniref:hypothetical protein n=1 Tax=Nocardia sp. NPDC050435 TaxID=3155040 RepID=UPI0033DB25D3